jgi:hypothetical protein
VRRRRILNTAVKADIRLFFVGWPGAGSSRRIAGEASTIPLSETLALIKCLRRPRMLPRGSGGSRRVSGQCSEMRGARHPVFGLKQETYGQHRLCGRRVMRQIGFLLLAFGSLEFGWSLGWRSTSRADWSIFCCNRGDFSCSSLLPSSTIVVMIRPEKNLPEKHRQANRTLPNNSHIP